MGIFKKLFDKLSTGFLYVVDKETLINYMNNEEQFSLENNLEASFDYNIYISGVKHHVQMWNFKASTFKDEQAKGVIYYFDDKEYQSIQEIIDNEMNNLPQYVKIELINIDNEYLNEYKKKHPELKAEEY